MSYTTILNMYYINHFPFLGLNLDTKTSADDISTIQNAINSKFNISICLTVPAIVIGLIIKKIPAIPALFIGTILGGIAAIFQTEIITELGGSYNYFQNSFTVLMDAMARDVNIVTENGMINELLSTGGMNGMLNTV